MRGRRRGRARGRCRGGRHGGSSRAEVGEDAERAFMWAMTGDKVEVRSDEEGFIGAWYSAEVVYLESSSTCIVEYEQLLAENGLPLQEPVLLCNLRPRPPPLTARPSWLQGHLVEAYDRDGWWTGVVVCLLIEHGLVLVRFRTTGEELTFPPSLLRGLQNWDNGIWTDLTEVGRPDEDQFTDAGDLNGSLSPLRHTELQKQGHAGDIVGSSSPLPNGELRKRGRPRKSKLVGQPDEDHVTDAGEINGSSNPPSHAELQKQGHADDFDGSFSPLPHAELQKRARPLKKKLVDRPDEAYFVDAGAINGSSSPLRHAELQKQGHAGNSDGPFSPFPHTERQKRGRPRKNKLVCRPVEAHIADAGVLNGSLSPLHHTDVQKQGHADDINGSSSPLPLTELQKRGRPRKGKRIAHPHEDHFTNAGDFVNSSSPHGDAELQRQGKGPSVDLPSMLPEELSQVMEPEQCDFPTSACAEPAVKAIKSHKRLFGCEIPGMEDPQTPTSVNEHFASALQAFTQHCRLELVSYQLLVKALRLKGPLNWNQELLLAAARLELNITNAEQSLVLEGLMPSNDERGRAYLFPAYLKT